MPARLRQKRLSNSITDPIVARRPTPANTQAVSNTLSTRKIARSTAATATPGKVVERKLRRWKGAKRGPLCKRMAAIVGVLMAKLHAGDESSSSKSVTLAAQSFVRSTSRVRGVVTRQSADCDTSDGRGDTSKTKLLVSESRRTAPKRLDLTVCRSGPPAQHRDADRRHDGYALTTSGRSTTARTYVLHSATQVSVVTTNLGGVIIKQQGEAGADPQAPGIMGANQLAAQHLPANPAASNVRVADAAAQRPPPGDRRVPRSPFRAWNGL